MSEWKAGDKAVCIGASEKLERRNSDMAKNGSPRPGTIYLVEAVRQPFSIPGVNCDWLGLVIYGFPTHAPVTGTIDLGWWEADFRKVIPASERISATITTAQPQTV